MKNIANGWHTSEKGNFANAKKPFQVQTAPPARGHYTRAERVIMESNVPLSLGDNWSNGSCLGYAIMAMEWQGLSKEQIKGVVSAMQWMFDIKTLGEADQHFYNSAY